MKMPFQNWWLKKVLEAKGIHPIVNLLYYVITLFISIK